MVIRLVNFSPITLHLLTYGDMVRLVIGLVTVSHPDRR